MDLGVTLFIYFAQTLVPFDASNETAKHWVNIELFDIHR